MDAFCYLVVHLHHYIESLRMLLLLTFVCHRLAIARALYQNSSILILDEATSALDSRSELLVREAVQRLTEKHTVRTN